MEGRIISVRKLVALDITLHGLRFISIEFGVGTPVILIVGLALAVGSGGVQHLLGLYLLITGINYLPILAYTIVLIRGGTSQREVAQGLAEDRHYVRKYSIQQLLIFVPFAVVLLAAYQESRRGELP